MVVAVKRKLQFWYWKHDKFLEFGQDIELNDIPKVLSWSGNCICVGYKTEYVMFDVRNSNFPLNSSKFPFISASGWEKKETGPLPNKFLQDHRTLHSPNRRQILRSRKRRIFDHNPVNPRREKSEIPEIKGRINGSWKQQRQPLKFSFSSISPRSKKQRTIHGSMEGTSANAGLRWTLSDRFDHRFRGNSGDRCNGRQFEFDSDDFWFAEGEIFDSRETGTFVRRFYQSFVVSSRDWHCTAKAGTFAGQKVPFGIAVDGEIWIFLKRI